MPTRYPKSGKGLKWTVTELDAISKDWASDTLSDGEGLSGEVRVSKDGSISIRWKYAFRWEGKNKWFQAGTYQSENMKTIRERRDNARLAKSRHINPNTLKAAQRIEIQRDAELVIEEHAARKAEQLTVKDMFDAWISDGVKRADGNASLRRRFEKDVLPFPPRHNSCRLLRTKNPGGGDEGNQWHVTDNHSRTGR
jgi:hypothetical protein